MNVIRHPRNRTASPFSNALDTTQRTTKRESRREPAEQIPALLDRRTPRRDESDLDGIAVLGEK